MEVSEKILGLKREDIEIGKKSGKFMTSLLSKLKPDKQDSTEMRLIAEPLFNALQELESEVEGRLIGGAPKRPLAEAAPETYDIN